MTSWSTGSGSTAPPELATATAITYLHVYNKYLRPLAGHRPLEQFELPGPVTEVLGQMAAAGVGQATRDNARKVLSSAFSWGSRWAGCELPARGTFAGIVAGPDVC